MARKKNNTLYESEIRKIKEDGSEEVFSRRALVRVEQEPDFIKIYTRMVCVLKDVGKCSGLLGELLKRMNYASEGQKIVLNPEEAKEIYMSAGISRMGYYRQIKELIDSGIIMPLKEGCYTGTFFVNPNIIGKGAWNDVKEIRACVTMNKDVGLLEVEASQEKTLTKNTWIPAGVGQTFLWNINELNKINKKLKPLQAEDEEE
ncbi:MAG: hypothetical protein EOL88_11585 [Bacteroidia bacterium]|jgi:hypothetical protein|nr:hypothetical protein [Synergistaceae bacterium]NCD42721.1 hypothetical protein [Bacteroidia bacterium]